MTGRFGEAGMLVFVLGIGLVVLGSTFFASISCSDVGCPDDASEPPRFSVQRGGVVYGDCGQCVYLVNWPLVGAGVLVSVLGSGAAVGRR